MVFRLEVSLLASGRCGAAAAVSGGRLLGCARLFQGAECTEGRWIVLAQPPEQTNGRPGCCGQAGDADWTTKTNGKRLLATLLAMVDAEVF